MRPFSCTKGASMLAILLRLRRAIGLSLSLYLIGIILTSVSISFFPPVSASAAVTEENRTFTEVTVAPKAPPLVKVRVQEAYGKLPLRFEANRGQTHRQVQFLSRGNGYSLFLTSTEAVLALRKPSQKAANTGRPEKTSTAVLRMKFVGANPAPRMRGLDELPSKSNYFIGNDPKQWHTDVPNYARIEYKDVYPGVDLVYYGNQRQLEYDFVVAPGADPKSITLGFQGTDRHELDAQGDLVLHTAGGQIRLHKPMVYQVVDGVRQEISGGYMLRDKHQVGFQVATYDTSRLLIIDPVLNYSSYLGGSGSDVGHGIAVDSAGNAYVVGVTTSMDNPNTVEVEGSFPTTAGAFQTVHGGGLFGDDAFVTKVNPSGTGLVYSTYLGGSAADQGTGIAVDSSGNAYVTGQTASSNFPGTSIAGTGCGSANSVFVTKLNATGSNTLYSAIICTSGFVEPRGIAVDSAGSAYVTGLTDTASFPTTSGAFQQVSGNLPDAFVTKLNAEGTNLVYSTFLGGNNFDIAFGIAVDSSGNAYVTGGTDSSNFPTTGGAFQENFGGSSGGGLRGDAFVTKLNSAGSELAYSTFVGSSGSEEGHGIAVDSAGNAYVVGYTTSTDNPLTEGFPLANPLPQDFVNGVNVGFSGDAFVTKLNAAGSNLVYSTYLGGSGTEGAFSFGRLGAGIAVDSAGNASVTGDTASTNFPTVNPLTQDATNGINVGSFGDTFVAKLNFTDSTLTLAYSTYLGGSAADAGRGIAVDASGNAYVTGLTFSTNFPTTEGAFQETFAGPTMNGSPVGPDAFVAKIGEEPAAPTCTFTTVGSTMTLNADCTTDTTILIPNGLTLDGAGYMITAVDPAGDHFRGAVVRNAGSVAHVTNLIVTASGLANVCDGGADRLRGIMFEGASGRISHNRVLSINQGASGCQEGNGIEVRNAPFDGTHPNTEVVQISHNTIDDYQKTGIVTNGDVSAVVEHNSITGIGPTTVIAQNGIQVGFGAKARVRYNAVSGNFFSPHTFASSGILLFSASGGTEVSRNNVESNDVGIGVIATHNASVENNKTVGSFFDGIALDDQAGPVGNNSVRNNQAENNGSGIGLYGSDNNQVENNQARENLAQGFFAGFGAGGNTFRGNHAVHNGTFGFEDDLSGSPVNTYVRNHCSQNVSGNSSPPGLCR